MPADATGQAGTQEAGTQANGWFTGLAWALYALSAACGVKAASYAGDAAMWGAAGTALTAASGMIVRGTLTIGK